MLNKKRPEAYHGVSKGEAYDTGVTLLDDVHVLEDVTHVQSKVCDVNPLTLAPPVTHLTSTNQRIIILIVLL